MPKSHILPAIVAAIAISSAVIRGNAAADPLPPADPVAADTGSASGSAADIATVFRLLSMTGSAGINCALRLYFYGDCYRLRL
ncbi:hypothetical protein OG225_27750 [Nocardia sp. NBC_01377]|uniref:hypothetical protein n=1 Tax=Nocardia sp. NBC_01377 TaxID=2903595 RepID=UPI0032567576